MLSLFCIHFFQCFDCAIPPVSSNPSCQSSGNLAYSQVARDPLPPAWHGWASPLSLWMTHRVPMGSWGLWSGSGPGSCDGRAMETIASFQSGLCQDCQCAVLDTAERVERFAHTMNPTPKLPESLELTKGRKKQGSISKFWFHISKLIWFSSTKIRSVAEEPSGLVPYPSPLTPPQYLQPPNRSNPCLRLWRNFH